MNQQEFDMFVESPTQAEVWAALGRGGPTCTSRPEGRPCPDCLPERGTPWIQLPSFCLNCPVFAVELRQHRVYLHSYNSSRCSCSLQGTGVVADWHWYIYTKSSLLVVRFDHLRPFLLFSWWKIPLKIGNLVFSQCILVGVWLDCEFPFVCAWDNLIDLVLKFISS